MIVQQQRCPCCGTHTQAHLLGPPQRVPLMPHWPGMMWIISCPGCKGFFSTYASWAAWLHPAVQDFMIQHPRWICEPEVLTEYASHPAVRARFIDSAGASQLVVLIHAQTMEVLATF